MLISWMAVVAAAGPCDDPEAVKARSAAILTMYDEGEAEKQDRSAAAASVLARDEARVAQMMKHDKAGELCTADDKWHAAWILTQADKVPTVLRAYELAQEAMNAGHPNGNWLVAYTFDLKSVAQGYRQSYGSQTQVNERGQRCLVEIEADVTDATRVEYGHPPLADVYKRVLELNGFAGDEPTFERIQRRGLSCKAEAMTRKAQRRVAAPTP